MSQLKMQELADFGQSIWLDYISRSLLDTGKLQSLIDQGLRGMTSNPSIFDQAISKSDDYDEKIRKFKDAGKSTFEIYDELTIKDIQDATDVFLPVYERTNHLDGYVSLEINPLLANQVNEQAAEGVRLFKKVGRPNLMIKVPSTPEGFPVIEQLIGQGIHVNVTLIFSLKQYQNTVKAYWKGLQKFAAKKGDLRQVHSVASVFVSRIDTMIDAKLEEMMSNTSDQIPLERLRVLKGKAAVANSRLIYEKSKELFARAEFQTLKEKGANLQRVLWGSTSTKNPDYSDLKYVTELIAPNTVNTIPANTLEAFLDHGEVGDAFTDNPLRAQTVINTLQTFGIDVNDVCATLLDKGVEAFCKSFESLQGSIEKKAQELCVK